MKNKNIELPFELQEKFEEISENALKDDHEICDIYEETIYLLGIICFMVPVQIWVYATLKYFHRDWKKTLDKSIIWLRNFRIFDLKQSLIFHLGQIHPFWDDIVIFSKEREFLSQSLIHQIRQTTKRPIILTQKSFVASLEGLLIETPISQLIANNFKNEMNNYDIISDFVTKFSAYTKGTLVSDFSHIVMLQNRLIFSVNYS